MASFQDLKDDLDGFDPRDKGLAAIEVARRVLALWQPCPSCEDGVWTSHDEKPPCSRCGGTGVVPSEKGWDILGGTVTDLAACLFGEGDR